LIRASKMFCFLPMNSSLAIGGLIRVVMAASTTLARSVKRRRMVWAKAYRSICTQLFFLKKNEIVCVRSWEWSIKNVLE
jgi:hypothetical protein